MNLPRLVPLLAITLSLSSSGQEARFFRIAGPVTTTITALSLDGTLSWTNASTNTAFTVQTAMSLVGEDNWVDYVQVPVTNAVNFIRVVDLNPPGGMALIPAGSFTMGDAHGDWLPEWGPENELPLHTVYVSAFYMDKCDVTKALWDSVHQWATNHGYSFENAGSGKAANHPVQTICWYDAAKWCNARSEMEELNPCYYTSAELTVVYRNGQSNLTNACVNWDANGYRLPTEAEWEKAARGGLSGKRFPWGNRISWSEANYTAYPPGYGYDTNLMSGINPAFVDGVNPYTSPVGTFAPNNYGLYDMAGNVWQYCWDVYDYGWYAKAAATLSDTRGPDEHAGVRVVRGGSWNNYAIGVRCATRDAAGYSVANYWYGFRCVRGH